MNYALECQEAAGQRLLTRIWCHLTPLCSYASPEGVAAFEARRQVNNLQKFGYPSLAALQQALAATASA
ncbi:hypothetical protein F0P96_10400 [Hymenobacter busanensis]|uniref:Uncharacterized protein n=1 Tax=Hymenobacter busanensis TaxID=2607656 RepID=A0A7L4ZXF2_9BACT|nr:hypothetical protein [Hymenobacter busanensis]KAA9333370.1 hypothetical protein F0P96_10400 [Hymenobacter busanensis]QHJ07951.1 hypothetical protein GUY19_11910 [Hymenobacter busanensis]